MRQCLAWGVCFVVSCCEAIACHVRVGGADRAHGFAGISVGSPCVKLVLRGGWLALVARKGIATRFR